MQVELDALVHGLQVQRDLARDLHQRAVIGARRELEGDPVAEERVGGEEQYQRQEQPGQQLLSQHRLLR